MAKKKSSGELDRILGKVSDKRTVCWEKALTGREREVFDELLASFLAGDIPFQWASLRVPFFSEFPGLKERGISSWTAARQRAETCQK